MTSDQTRSPDTGSSVDESFISAQPIRFVTQYGKIEVWRSDIMRELDEYIPRGDSRIKMELHDAYDFCVKSDNPNSCELGAVILRRAILFGMDVREW